jgi:hypothetical protein
MKLKHGYEVQLETYKQSNETETGFYVIIDIGKGGRRIEAVHQLEAAARNEGQRYSPVCVIDATPKESASKRATERK